LDPIEKQLLSDAVETDWGLHHEPGFLRMLFPDETSSELIEIARLTMSSLVRRGLVRLYWLSDRPASEAEATEFKANLEVSGTREVVMPVRRDIGPDEVSAVLSDDSNWRPPQRTTWVAFSATELGLTAYFAAKSAASQEA
jgi:hypothetical protein